MPRREAEVRLVRNARREAWVVAAVWALALVWSVGYCYLNGYRHDADSWVVRAGLAEPRQDDRLERTLGFPHWVFAGIMVPWLLCTAFTVWFGLFGMADDDLGADRDEGDARGH